MKKLKMGYVGCGGMAQKVHMPNIMGLDNCELVALAEVRPKLGKKVQERFRIPQLYADHKQLAARKEIQAVCVSGHFSGQGEIARDLLEAGKDVFMEKPMAVSVAQAERMLKAEKKSGKRLMIAYMKRYDAGNVLVKKLIEKGKLGEMRFVRSHDFDGDWTAGLDTPFDDTDEKYPDSPCILPAWLPDKCRDGYLGYLQEYTHNVNLVRWFLDAGGDIKVKAVELDLKDGYRGAVILEIAGITTVLESGSVACHDWDDHTQIYFENGWIKTHSPPLLLRSQPAAVEMYCGNTPDKTTTQFFPEHGRLWSYKAEMMHFIKSVLKGTPFRTPASDALHDVKTFEEIYKKHVAKVT